MHENWLELIHWAKKEQEFYPKYWASIQWFICWSWLSLVFMHHIPHLNPCSYFDSTTLICRCCHAMYFLLAQKSHLDLSISLLYAISRYKVQKSLRVDHLSQLSEQAYTSLANAHHQSVFSPEPSLCHQKTPQAFLHVDLVYPSNVESMILERPCKLLYFEHTIR